jgi:hypothetical protein
LWDGYFCFGGTEIINNARAILTAQTAPCPIDWFDDVPCDGIYDMLSDDETTTYTPWAVVRTNLVTNPKCGVDTTGWGSLTVAMGREDDAPNNMGTALWVVSSGVTPTKAQWTVPVPVTPDVPFTVQASMCIDAGSVPFHVVITWRDAGGATIGSPVAGSDAAVTTDQVTIVSTTQVPPEGAVTALFEFDSTGLTPEYATFYVSSVCAESGTTGPAFDGSDPSGRLIQYEWTGTPDASTSVYETRAENPVDPTTLYSYDNISEAPWYDEGALTNADSQDFLGVYCISAENLADSTNQAPVVERIDEGGVIGRQRRTSRAVRFRVLLTALSEAGLEYGLSWLDSRLAEKGCSTHPGSSCGTSDMTFFVECAPAYDPDEEPWEVYTARVDLHTRVLHGVKCTTAPLIQTKLERGERYGGTYARWGYIVEFTLTAEQPRMYGVGYTPEITNWGTLLAADVPTNLAEYPSGELASSGTQVVATNHSINPSVETDAVGWAASSTVLTPAVTSGARSTDLAAVGTASFKIAVTTTNAGTNGTLRAYQDVALPTDAAYRFSATMWGVMQLLAGTAVLGSMQLQIDWRSASASLRVDNLTTGPASGGALSVASVQPPAGATIARVSMYGKLTSWAVGAQLVMYADALAVTTP